MENVRITTRRFGIREMISQILVTLLSLLILTVPRCVYAAIRTVGPGDCSASAVNSAITSASNGDTVELTCTGSVTWTATVTIPSTKGIILKGPGNNTPKSSASFPLIIVSNQNPAISVIAGSGNPLSRLTGFKFRGDNTTGDQGFLRITGTGTGPTGLGAFRVDNNYFDQVSGAVIVAIYTSSGNLFGLFDNNSMVNCWYSNNPDYGPYGVDVENWYRTGNCWGKNGWLDPFAFGSKDFVFIEDNLFENTAKYMRHFIDAGMGGKYVVRHNDVNVTIASPAGNITDPICAHGYCLAASNGAGTRGGEIYGNTFKGDKMGRPVDLRGGHWLIYDNSFSAIGYTSSPINFFEYRAGSSGMYSQCSSTSPCSSTWYPIVTDGSHYPLEQQVSATYVWNNVYNGANQLPAVDAGGVQGLYIQSGRDYFVGANKPAALSAYVSYTYPHPLRGPGSGTVLTPPTGLRIIP